MNELAFFNDLFDSVLAPAACATSLGRGVSPRTDVKESKDSYAIDMELPGMTDKDVSIELDNGVLTIESAGERKDEEKFDEKDGVKFLIHERCEHSFRRSFTLPEDADGDSVSAEFKNGLLSVNIPRKQLPAAKRIEIRAA